MPKTTDIIREYPNDTAAFVISRVWRDHKIKLTSSQIYNVRSRDKLREAAGKSKRSSKIYQLADIDTDFLHGLFPKSAIPKVSVLKRQMKEFQEARKNIHKSVVLNDPESAMQWHEASNELINLMAHLGLDRSEQLLEQLRAQWATLRVGR